LTAAAVRQQLGEVDWLRELIDEQAVDRLFVALTLARPRRSSSSTTTLG
jgi:hypothetical protein